MTLIIYVDIDQDNLSPSDPNESLFYRAKISTEILNDLTGDIRPGNLGIAYPTGRIDLGSLVRGDEEITRRFRAATRGNGYYGAEEELDFDIPPDHNSGPAEPNDEDKKRAKDRFTRQLRSDIDKNINELDRVFNEPLYETFITVLEKCLESSQKDELIKLVISSNDRRIETLPFLQTRLISTSKNGGKRNICIIVVPQSKSHRG